ncbi:MAG: FHA domain-containing protein [Phycisphaerae bacterium]|nr:FHA domain-containing protein [Tepidisphaeraceae bacterium]
MPVLILYNLAPGTPPRGMLLADAARVVIGRRPFNTVMVADPAVSRIHAWIGRRPGDDRFTLYDAGSRSGTILNNQPVREPRTLRDGDKVRVGPATLVYFDDQALPDDVEQFIPPDDPPPAADPYDGGIYFDCPCGGPMWVTADLAGASGRCRYCGQRLLVPHMSGATARPLTPDGVGTAAAPVARVKRPPPRPAPPAPAPIPAVAKPQAAATVTVDAAAGQATCSICQTAIAPGEDQTTCPSCHLSFHAGCWEENFGCSAYGCDQVNVLNPDRDPPAVGESDQAAAAESPVEQAALVPPVKVFPFDTLILALSFVAMGLGALLFGAPSAVMLLWALAFLIARKPGRRGLVALAAVIGLLGTVAGIVTSMFWWKGVRLWEWVLR